MMRLKFAHAAIVLGGLLMLSACGDGDPVDLAYGTYGNSAPTVAIGDASATLIGATSDPCKRNLDDPYWKQHGGQDGYEQWCGHSPPD